MRTRRSAAFLVIAVAAGTAACGSGGTHRNNAGSGGAGGGGVIDSGTHTAITVPVLGVGFDYYQGSYALGWTFTPNVPITVTALGFYDDLKNGLTASHPVAIYDKTTQAILAQVTVSPSDPLAGYFHYAPLASPLALAAGTTYVAVTLVGTERYLAFNSLDPMWTIDPAITYAGSAVNYGNDAATTLLFPDTFGPTGGDFGPDFQFTTN